MVMRNREGPSLQREDTQAGTWETRRLKRSPKLQMARVTGRGCSVQVSEAGGPGDLLISASCLQNRKTIHFCHLELHGL